MRASLLLLAVSFVFIGSAPTIGQIRCDRPGGSKGKWPGPTDCRTTPPGKPICPTKGGRPGSWCDRPRWCPPNRWRDNCYRGRDCRDDWQTRFPLGLYPPVAISAPYYADAWAGWWAENRYYDSEPVQYAYTPASAPSRVAVVHPAPDRRSQYSLVLPLQARKPLSDIATQRYLVDDGGPPQLAGLSSP